MLKKFLNYFLQRLRGEVPTAKLVKMGMKVGKGFKRMQGCSLDVSHCWLISIGDDVTFAPNVRLIAHDASTKRILGYSKIGRITIGNNVFIGANVIILPNVVIGDNAIIGSGSVVTKDIPGNAVAAGNPAKVISSFEEYIEKNKALVEKRPVYDSKWTMQKGIDENMKKEMKKSVSNGIAFVE